MLTLAVIAFASMLCEGAAANWGSVMSRGDAPPSESVRLQHCYVAKHAEAFPQDTER
jgi:hypothetical protein